MSEGCRKNVCTLTCKERKDRSLLYGLRCVHCLCFGWGLRLGPAVLRCPTAAWPDRCEPKPKSLGSSPSFAAFFGPLEKQHACTNGRLFGTRLLVLCPCLAFAPVSGFQVSANHTKRSSFHSLSDLSRTEMLTVASFKLLSVSAPPLQVCERDSRHGRPLVQVRPPSGRPVACTH